MLAHFFDPHEGIAGAGAPLPAAVAAVVRAWDGQTGEPAVVAAAIRAAIVHDSLAIMYRWVDGDGGDAAGSRP